MEDLGLPEDKAIEQLQKIKTRATDLGLAAKQPTTGFSLKDRMLNATV